MTAETGKLTLRTIACTPPSSALLVPVSDFPASKDDASVLFVRQLSAALRMQFALDSELFFHVPNLARGGANKILSAHGREWAPRQGLGVWPSRGAPKPWTKEEFMSLDAGQQPRPIMDNVFQVSKKEAIREADESMRGFGSMIEFLVPFGDRDFFKRSKELLFPKLDDPMFRVFKFYIPMLDAEAVGAATGFLLERWMCGARAMIRESPDDKGFLVVSLAPLGQVLESIGAISPRDPQGEWTIPEPRR
jgi:hypothetical protein